MGNSACKPAAGGECSQASQIKNLLDVQGEQEKRLHTGDLVLQQLGIGMADIQQTAEKTRKTVDLIYNKLFIDNGTPSMQTRLNQHAGILKVLCWATGAAGVVVIGVTVKGLIKLLGGTV